MNAKMVITVPIENIPDEINKLMQNILERMQSTTKIITDCSGSTNHLEVIEKIDLIRKNLNLMDLNLDDCYNILLGYIKYNTELRIKEKQQTKELSTNES